MKDVKDLAKELGLEQAVIFTGFRHDVPNLIATMDVCVHASNLPDPCPLVIFDYMAAGKPVTATSGGGVPEIIIDGATSILVPMKDPTALERAIMEMLNNPEKRKGLGQCGEEKGRRTFYS